VIEISLFRRQVNLSPHLQALAKAATSRKALQNRLVHQFERVLPDYEQAEPLQVPEDLMRWMVQQYSEQVIFEPLEEISHWFSYSSGEYLLDGYPALFYNRTETRPITANKSAVAGVGEGVAGLLAQRLFRCHLLARPVHDFPDAVMTAEDGTIYLIEAKATMDSPTSLQPLIQSEIIKLAGYASTCREIDIRPIKGLLIATAIISETQYQAYLTEVVV
jgi:hypothetical protein